MHPAGSPPPDLPPTIGRYKIVARLAPLRHDHVYHGFDPMIERPLVVKVFSLSGLAPAEADAIRQVFFSEMRRTGMLAHPGITTLFDAGETPGGLFMATEFVDGSSLDDSLETVLAWPIADRVSLLVQLADALDYAREQGVPHLHLRPSHVLIGPDAAPKIRGFGIARVHDALRAAHGTAAPISTWTAPERLAGELGDARADVFSLARLAQLILGDSAGDADAALAPVWHEALAQDAASRFESVGAFKYALLLALGMGEGELRMAWEASREAGSLLDADRGEPSLPQSAVNGDLTALLSEAPTQLTPSGVEDLLTMLQTGVTEDDTDPSKSA